MIDVLDPVRAAMTDPSRLRKGAQTSHESVAWSSPPSFRLPLTPSLLHSSSFAPLCSPI